MRIGVFCSGGDAPGMNACVRAVVRTASQLGHDVVGIYRGYHGLLHEEFFVAEDGRPHMTSRSVSGWSERGGAFLRSSRSEEFRTEEGQKKAADVLRKHGIDALVPIGGDGTFSGALALARHWDGQIVGCPGTIDNDLSGTDYTIGFWTAVQTAVEAVDKIRDTAESHERMFLIEVMGRHSGYIAVYTALASAAEIACIPETPTDIDRIVYDLKQLKARGKASIMMIVAEGDERGGAQVLNEQLKLSQCPFSTRVVILGHLQRGGAPLSQDRIIAGMLGRGAVNALNDGLNLVMAGMNNGRVAFTPLTETIAVKKVIPKHLLDLVETLAQ
ncbi:MAG: ATP-dependent 6-phosphofructokinase [Pirellulaceae bacterium]